MQRAMPWLFLFFIISASVFAVIIPSTIAISKPSAPEFTLESISYPYDVPTTYTTDPFSGETMTHPGYHVENKTIVFKIKNQPFTPYTVNGSEVNLFYQVRMKGHFETDNWYTIYWEPNKYPKWSTSEYTTFPARFYAAGSDNFKNGDQLDIQVQALVGSIVFVNGRMWGQSDYYTFDGVKGDWSSTYVYTVGQFDTPLPLPSTTIPTPTQSDSQVVTSTPNNTVTENPATSGLNLLEVGIFALLAVIAVLLVLVVFYLRKKSRN